MCPNQPNTPDVNFCVESSAEDKNEVFIGNVNSPQYANNHCTCTITPLNFVNRLTVNLKEIPVTANIRFVLEDRRGIEILSDSTIAIPIRGVVQVIYQTADSDQIDPICLKLQASATGTFSVSCARYERFNEKIHTSPGSPTKILVGPIIGGICAVIVIIIAVIVIVVVVRRRKLDKQNPSQTDEDITTENPIYDRDGTPNDETNIQNHDTNNDAVHYSTVQLSDAEYAEPYTRSETNQNANYSKVDKTSKPCQDNKSRNIPHNQEHSDDYDRTDVKKEVQPFNEYNHLSTVHRHSQDALGDYNRTNIHLAQINEGHDEEADTYNTAFAH